MHKPTTPILLALTSLLTGASAFGIPLVVSPGLNVSTHPNIPAHLPSCTNLTAAPTIPCYTKLNTTSYLTNYNLTMSEVCAPEESWSTCLLRAVYDSPGAHCVPTSNTTQKCDPFDCASLNSTTCIQPQPSNRTDITQYEAASWYAVWNVYAVHLHIWSWATALNRTTSEHAILASINPRVANTDVSVLKALITQYGINTNADAGILTILNSMPVPQVAFGNGRVTGETNTLTGAQWRAMLVARLGDVLQTVNFVFGKWLPMVEGGAYSTSGLSGPEALAMSLARK